MVGNSPDGGKAGVYTGENVTRTKNIFAAYLTNKARAVEIFNT